MATTPLSELPLGSNAIVRELPPNNPRFIRLREMGLLPGTPFTFVRTAPLGDPLELKIRGHHLSIRKAEAVLVLVEKLA